VLHAYVDVAVVHSNLSQTEHTRLSDIDADGEGLHGVWEGSVLG